MPRPEQEGEGKMDNAPLTTAFLWRLSTLQPRDALARHVQGQLGLQPGGPEAGETFWSQQRGWVSVRDTQSPTPLTIRDAQEKSCLLVTSNSLRSNKDELLGDNCAQQAFSTPKGEGTKAKASRTKSKKPGQGPRGPRTRGLDKTPKDLDWGGTGRTPKDLEQGA